MTQASDIGVGKCLTHLRDVKELDSKPITRISAKTYTLDHGSLY